MVSSGIEIQFLSHPAHILVTTLSLVLCPICVREKVGVNRRGTNKKRMPVRNNGVDMGWCNTAQPKVVKTKVRGRKLRSGVYWQGALKKNGMKQVERTKRATFIPIEFSRLAIMSHLQ